MSLSFITCKAEVQRRNQHFTAGHTPRPDGPIGSIQENSQWAALVFWPRGADVQSRCRVGTHHGCCPHIACPLAECSLLGDVIRWSALADGVTLPGWTLQFSSLEDDESRLESGTWKEEKGALKRREWKKKRNAAQTGRPFESQRPDEDDETDEKRWSRQTCKTNHGVASNHLSGL